MAEAWFVTGTDTGAGKTVASLGLMAALTAAGRRTAGMKPVASGAEAEDGPVPRNGDALRLQALGPTGIDYADVNPYAFRAPIAPHIAALREGARVQLPVIAAAFERVCAHADAVIVEGIGGWRVPLNEDETTADLVRHLGLPVILVVGLRLGCINHALLTAEAVARDGLELCAWIANGADPDYREAGATAAFLDTRMGVPRMGSIPHLARPDPQAVAACLDVGILLRP